MNDRSGEPPSVPIRVMLGIYFAIAEGPPGLIHFARMGLMVSLVRAGHPERWPYDRQQTLEGRRPSEVSVAASLPSFDERPFEGHAVRGHSRCGTRRLDLPSLHAICLRYPRGCDALAARSVQS
jgi:hypothetical protein